MNYFSKVFITLLALAVGSTGFSASAIAQEQERFMALGNDSEGTPVFLDLANIRGARFKLLTQRGDNQAVEITMRVACGEGTVTMEKITLFDNSGNVLLENHESEVLPVSPHTPVANARSVVCKAMGAKNW